MNGKNILFLHYGPGGNSQVEKNWLSLAHPDVTFFDLKECDGESVNFESMLKGYQSVLEKLSVQKSIQLVAHSFGADLALALAHKNPKKVNKIILISPVRDIGKAFLRLGQQLEKLPSSTENLKSSVKDLKLALLSSKDFLENFWKFVGEAFKNPEILNQYWGDTKQFEKYVNVSQKCKPMDMAQWQAGLNDYLLKARSVYDLGIPCPIQVVLGESDPYYDISEESKYWVNRVGKENIKVVQGCGHYPHLEKSTLDFF